MIEKKTALDKCEVVNMDTLPIIQCRHVTWVEEDGVMIGGKSYHRHVLTPHSDLTDEDPTVVALANVLFTQAVKDAYTAKLAEADNV